MNRILAFLLCIAMLFALCGCGAGSYHKATDGDLTVSLPEKTDEEKITPPEVLALLGKWKLVSIVNDGVTTEYKDSYYEFRESGKIKIKLERNTDMGVFSVTENTITIKSGISVFNITYVLNGDTLTLTDQDNDIHNLVKISEETP